MPIILCFPEFPDCMMPKLLHEKELHSKNATQTQLLLVFFNSEKKSPIPHFAKIAESLAVFSIVWRASGCDSPAWVYFWLCHWGVSNPEQTTWPLWLGFFFSLLFSCSIKSLIEELVISLHLWGVSCNGGESRTKAKALRKAYQDCDINNQLDVLLETGGFNCMTCLSPLLTS